MSGIEETVARVRDALDGVPDSTTLYARGMKLTGWRHEVTAGEVRTLLAAVDTRTRENAAFVSAVREAIGFCEGDESPEELVSFVQSMSERIPELTRERDALREAVETKDRAHGMAVDREFAAIARADRYRAALEALALVSDAEVERLARETYHEIGGPPSGMTPAWETMSPGFRVNRMAFVRAGMQGAAPTLGEVLKVYGGRK